MKMQKIQLKEVAKVEISGVDKKTKPGQKTVRLCNFTDVYYNWAITKSMYDSLMVASASQKEIDSFSLHKGQVALTKDSETRFDIGIPTYIADDFEDVVLGYHTALISPDESKVYGKYLNAFLQSPYMHKYFANNATGSGQRYTLSTETLETIPLLLPSLGEQKRIGKFLSQIDRKISLNREINRNLEALAKQLYEYWFVQFDFPDENGRPYKSSGGKMVWNNNLKREIPYGWESLKIGNILDKVISTPRLVTNEYNNSGEYPIIDQTTDLYYAGFTDKKDAVVNQFPAVIFGDHSCAVKYVNFPFVRGADGTQVMLSNNINISIEYLYFFVKSIKIGKGYARHFSFLKEQPIIVPTSTIAKRFEKEAQILFKQITNNRKENLSLAKQRDELLPLLMNGQVTIKE